MIKINIKEPYKTAIFISLATSVILGVAYLALPKVYKDKMGDFVKYKVLKKDKNKTT